MKKNRHPILKGLAWALCVAIALFALTRVYYALTDDFRLSNITYDMPYEQNWTVEPLSVDSEHDLQRILNQPFKYLGKGAQSYAFASADGQYVLKFFKFKHLRPSWFVDALPPIGFLKTYKDKQAARKTRKLFGVFNSYKLAYEVDRNESGLLFIQLNTTGNLPRRVVIIDKIGLKHVIDLESFPFILQHKGETLRVVLARLLDAQEVDIAKNKIGQIFDLYAEEYRKGVFDHDHGVMQNTGFVADRPIHLDVGKLLQDEKMRNKEYARKDAFLVADKIKSWIKGHYPHYSDELSAYIDHKIDKLF